MANLKEFVGKLAQDQSLKDRYMANPSKTMTDEGLSTADREAILSGDRAKIAAQIDPAAGQTGFGISVNVLVVLGVT